MIARLLAWVTACAVMGCALGAQATAADFGDAPAPYPTCEHQFTMVPAYRWTNLGNMVSDDSAGPNPVPGGFDADTRDDGVKIRRLLPSGQGGGGQPYYAELFVYCWNAVYDKDALGVWMDFNDDGDWDDPDEQVVYAVAGFDNQIASQQPPPTWHGLRKFESGHMSGFRVFLPPSAATSIKTRVRVWNIELSGGPFARGQMGSPAGVCVGGECEDYDFPCDTLPNLIVADRLKTPIPEHGVCEVGMLVVGQAVPVEWYIWNLVPADGPTLWVSGVTISNEVDCTAAVVVSPHWSWPQAAWNQVIILLEIAITLTADYGSFTVTVHSNDPETPDFEFIVAGTRGLTGSYVLDNSPGATADFTSFGELFDELERGGVREHVEIVVKEGPSPYLSDERCGLGLAANLESLANQPEWEGQYFFNWQAHSVTIRAAPGHRPRIEGSGVRFRILDEEYQATLAICGGYITFEGIEISGGRDFGLLVVNNRWGQTKSLVIQACRVHDIDGPGVFVMCTSNHSSAAGVTRVENCFFWDCRVGGARAAMPVTANGVTVPVESLGGVLSFYNIPPSTIFNQTQIYIRCNTILCNTPAQPPTAACASFVACRAEEMIGNIFYQTSATQPKLYCHNGSDEPIYSDFNCLHGPAGSPTCASGAGIVAATLADWKNRGYDFNSIAVNPQLRSITPPFDLHLKYNSPMIDAYDALTPLFDVDGDTRPQRARMDIGADELPPNPLMQVLRGGTLVASGATDDTGAAITPLSPTQFTYTIVNNGAGPLRLDASPQVQLSTQNGVTAALTQPPPNVIAPQSSAQFVVTVIAPTGVFRLDFTIPTNDPGADPYRFSLLCDTPPRILVPWGGGTPVAPGQKLSFAWGTSVASIGLLIRVLDSDLLQTVALQGQVGNHVLAGFVPAEFSGPAAPAPWSLAPASGVLDNLTGSTHHIILVADTGLRTVSFSFTIEGDPPYTEVEIRDGGLTGPKLASNAPAPGTSRSFAIRDIKAGPSPAIAIVLENTGGAPVSVTTPEILGAPDFHVAAGVTPTMLQPGTAIYFYVTFDPAAVGARVATLVINHGGMNQPRPFLLPLEGVAVDVPAVVITTDVSLPRARSGDHYAPIDLVALGGLAPYVWSVSSGSLPEGLSLSAGGELAGMPVSSAGTYHVDIRVRDAVGQAALRQFEIQVLAPRPPGRLPNDGLAGRDNGAAACVAGEAWAPWWLPATLFVVWLMRQRRGGRRRFACHERAIANMQHK